jgi:hypothetical protein
VSLLVCADRSWWGILPLRTDSPFYAPEGSTVAETEVDGAFVNAGTHQVPLFQGLPPLEVLNSFDPLDTVLTKLRRDQPMDSSGCFCCSGQGVLSAVAVSPFPDEFESPVLSSCGSSAIIRLVDAKMARFCSNHIKVDNQLVDTTLLNQIIEAQAGGNAKMKVFEYNPLKYELEPSTESLVLVAFQKDCGLLTDAINRKTETDVQDYIDRLM